MTAADLVIEEFAEELARLDSAHRAAIEAATSYRELFLLTLTFLHHEYKARIGLEEQLRQSMGLANDAEAAQS